MLFPFDWYTSPLDASPRNKPRPAEMRNMFNDKPFFVVKYIIIILHNPLFHIFQSFMNRESRWFLFQAVQQYIKDTGRF